MEKLFSLMFPPLTLEDKVRLQRTLRARRAQVLDNTLEKIRLPEIQEKLGRNLSAVHLFLREITFLSQNNPDLLWRVIDHWSMSFLLSRLLLDRELGKDTEQLNQLASNLTGLLLMERLLNGTQLSATAFTLKTDGQGRIHSLLHEQSLQLNVPDAQNQIFQWSFSGDEVKVAREAGVQVFTLTLPLQDNPQVMLLPLSLEESAISPVLDETILFGPNISHGSNPKNTGKTEERWNPMPLGASLSEARQVIDRMMPEALGWAETMVPAFIDIGIPPGKDARSSGSYEPGSPVFLSRVADPLCHAEDVVHEVQHHRLLLFASETHFKTWNDLRQVYVSPYRPDPRPLRGLYIGIHAFLTVNELKKRLLEEGGAPESLILEVIDTHFKNLFVFRTILEHEGFSEFTEQLTSQMASMLCQHHDFVRSLKRPAMEKACEEKLTAHILRVEPQATEILNNSPKYRDWEQTVEFAAAYSQAREKQAVAS